MAQVNKFKDKYKQDMIDDFSNYWTEKNMTTGKMKYEMQNTFDISRRLSRWHKYSFEFNSKSSEVVVSDDIVEKNYQEQQQRFREAEKDVATDEERRKALGLL